VGFSGKRLRISLTADSEQGQLHAGEYAVIVVQMGTIQEGIREYSVRLDSGKVIDLKPSEVELLDPPPAA
jgi:hypothetical protein